MVDKMGNDNESYWKYLDEWEEECSFRSARVRKDVSELPDEYFCVGKDWIQGCRRDETNLRIEKVLAPYVYFRDRRRAAEAQERVQKVQEAIDAKLEGKDAPKGEVPVKSIVDDLEQPPLKEKWGQEGMATLKDGIFQFNMIDGKKFEIPLAAFMPKAKKDGELFYFIKIQDIPTNLFRKGDDTSKLYNIQQLKMREI